MQIMLTHEQAGFERNTEAIAVGLDDKPGPGMAPMAGAAIGLRALISLPSDTQTLLTKTYIWARLRGRH